MITSEQSWVIDVRDVRKTYREGLLRRRRIDALRGVSLQVEQGHIFGLLGPNGAGKTTLIKVLLGIVRSTAGVARLLGHPAGHRLGRAGVGYLPESHRIPHHFTGHSALEYYGRLSGLTYREIRSRRGSLLDRVGLSQWGNTYVRKYSKGMLQRLGLAQAMLHDPPLLILDEPTDGVDPVGRSEMREVLQRLQSEQKTIFINSHLLQEVELVCDQVAIMHQGQLRHIGTVDELTSNSREHFNIRLLGDEPRIRAALGPRLISQWEAGPDGTWDLEVAVLHATDIDVCVDSLRAAGIGIRALAPRRRTLEQAFLDIIQRQSATLPVETPTDAKVIS